MRCNDHVIPRTALHHLRLERYCTAGDSRSVCEVVKENDIKNKAMLMLCLKNGKCKISVVVFVAEEMFLAATLPTVVGEVNRDAVCL